MANSERTVMTNRLIVCGSWDEHGGRPSGYMRSLFKGVDATIYNGGTLSQLDNLIKEPLSDADIVYWFPDIPNDAPKIVQDIKRMHQRCTLITSKNNLYNRYTHEDIIARALNTKSNLLLELNKHDGKFLGTVHDPLGNIFIRKAASPADVFAAMERRVGELRSFTRVSSRKVGPADIIPDEAEFFDIIRGYAGRFHELVHAANSERLLGNASFRCTKGFPGFRHNGNIFVSRRNIDKRCINRDGFVQVELSDSGVEFYGDAKPSVDTPSQLKLLYYYRDINYILHSHTYIEGALYTDQLIPCGAVEEAAHIINAYPYRDTKGLKLNLIGHGSLVLAGDVSYMRDINYMARPVPELYQK